MPAIKIKLDPALERRYAKKAQKHKARKVVCKILIVCEGTKTEPNYFKAFSLISFPTIIHPSVIMGDPSSIKIGEGCIICAGNVLTTNIEINDFVTLNLACTVGHDAVIGKFSSFMPSCNISGEVIVENKVYCGTGVKIINQVQIGDNAVIGAGAVVTQNIPANCTAVGIPAKPIKFIK